MTFPKHAGALLQEWLDHDESAIRGRGGAGAGLDRVRASDERSPRLGGLEGGVGRTVANGGPIVGRLLIVVVVAVAALAIAASAAFAAGELPRQWDPREIAVNREAGNTFLLRPGQILAGPGDAEDVARVLMGWRRSEERAFGVTMFTRAPANLADPAGEVLDAVARVRKATADRPQGPALVAPNHVFVGEAASDQLLWRAAHAGRAGFDRAPSGAAGGAAVAHDPA